MNEPYATAVAARRAAPRRDPARHVPRARHRDAGSARVRLLGAGTILREALAAADLLLEGLRHCGRRVLGDELHGTAPRRVAKSNAQARLGAHARVRPGSRQQLPQNGTPVVAASDYVSAVADLIRPWIARSRTWCSAPTASAAATRARQLAPLLRGRPPRDRGGGVVADRCGAGAARGQPLRHRRGCGAAVDALRLSAGRARAARAPAHICRNRCM